MLELNTWIDYVNVRLIVRINLIYEIMKIKIKRWSTFPSNLFSADFLLPSGNSGIEGTTKRQSRPDLLLLVHLRILSVNITEYRCL